MNGVTQANRLAQLVQSKRDVSTYELTLPLVMVQSSNLRMLVKNDVLMLGLDRLECMLMQKDKTYVQVMPIRQGNSTVLEVLSVAKTIDTNNSKKYEVLKLSFGMIESSVLRVGNIIDLLTLNLENVTLIVNEKIIAIASLINVNDEIAVQINKVVNNE